MKVAGMGNMAALPGTNSNFSSPYTRVVLSITTSGTTALLFAVATVSAFAQDLYDRARRVFEEPLLRAFRAIPSLVFPVSLERFVQKMVAPVVGGEPEFVGGGAMYRRWR